MNIDFGGRTAIISGSTGGIGLAIARGLARANADVVIAGRSQQSLDAALAELREQGGRGQIHGVVADLGTAAGAATLFAAHPRADILVNNLGIYDDVDFFEVADSEWTRFYDTNVLSGVRLARHYAPGMVEKGWGRILFISSESGIAIPADMINYGVTKAANLAVSHGLAKRLAGTGVTVNAVLPGPTLTDGVAALVADAAQASGRSIREEADNFVRTARPSSIIQRAADVDEVAHRWWRTSKGKRGTPPGVRLRRHRRGRQPGYLSSSPATRQGSLVDTPGLIELGLLCSPSPASQLPPRPH